MICFVDYGGFGVIVSGPLFEEIAEEYEENHVDFEVGPNDETNRRNARESYKLQEKIQR